MVEIVQAAEAIIPIFIFSLPRSGSTLLQRILATHPSVATASEPWLLLPFLYSRRPGGIYSEYNHRKATRALEDFVSELPGGSAAYLGAVRELALDLYARRAGPGAHYFVDKTPRYHVVASEIVRTFPDGRFIFLWRNPLAIIGSMIETWGRGRWNLYEFSFDLFEGLPALIEARRKAGLRAISIRYGDLVAESPAHREQLFRYLGLDIEDSHPERQQEVQLTGRMGDQKGGQVYRELSQEPRFKWKRLLASPLRKLWCRRYLRWIGRDRLAFMGYDLDELLRELDAVPTSWETVPSDLWRMVFGVAVRAFEPWIARDKWSELQHGGRMRAHA